MRPYLLLLLLLFSPLSLAAQAAVTGMAASGSRVEILLDGTAELTHFTLAKPDRLVLDLVDTRLATRLPRSGFTDTPVVGVRSGRRPDGKLRLVLELTGPARPKVSRGEGRVAVELGIAAPAKAGATPAVTRSVSQMMAAHGLRDVVIAIDAGHGGKDVGAEGSPGVFEKDVVLEVARELSGLVARERGMRPVMIRDGDHFLRLRTRMQRAREAQADLFVSLHANSFPQDRSVRGASVYVLSNRGATSEAARFLAQKENDADLIGGVSLDDKDDQLGRVLLDLAQTATLEDSMVAASNVLKQMGRVGSVHKRRVERAGFMVLKSPDVPSMLVELAFITNATDERNLTSRSHRRKLARAILDGIRGYFDDHAPPGTILAERTHKVRRGETLSGLAERYGVTQEALMAANDLRDTQLDAGRELRIPHGG